MPGLALSPDCFEETNLNAAGNTYRLKRSNIVFTHPDMMSRNVTTPSYYHFIWAIAQGCVTPTTWNFLYNPAQGAAGNPAYSPDGFLIDLLAVSSAIANDPNTPCNNAPGCTSNASNLCIDVTSTNICRPPCQCAPDPSGTY